MNKSFGESTQRPLYVIGAQNKCLEYNFPAYDLRNYRYSVIFCSALSHKNVQRKHYDIFVPSEKPDKRLRKGQIVAIRNAHWVPAPPTPPWEKEGRMVLWVRPADIRAIPRMSALKAKKRFRTPHTQQKHKRKKSS